MATRPGASSKKARVEDRVDIVQRHYGEDFEPEKAEAMLNSEIKVILDRVNNQQQVDFDDLSEMMQNTTTYVQTFGKMADEDTIGDCKADLVDKGLHTFEAASMGNLMPANAEEAKALIMSLTRFQDDEIQEFCNIVKRHKKD
ncbi:HRDC-like protein [Baffinella frigidus]|nr:HRDC-like protein [Cryptophyta sp. CCMP2293]|mmetsp:Transcript_2644/g.6525  ORF Transcript_2644/g.6525 Transcript_2644/m.6525 type:complete len:143 (-) Transcript_2644:86-514(-)